MRLNKAFGINDNSNSKSNNDDDNVDDDDTDEDNNDDNECDYNYDHEENKEKRNDKNNIARSDDRRISLSSECCLLRSSGRCKSNSGNCIPANPLEK